jgi:hypothetical protein
MVEVSQSQLDKYGEDGDIRNEDETQTIVRKKEKSVKKKGKRKQQGDDTTTFDETPAQKRKRAKERK